MNNILRYTPTEDAFDDLFRGFFLRPVLPDSQQGLQIKMDVNEDDKEYVVHAEIPGVKKEDINITIDGRQVAISAELKNEKDIKEGEKLLRSERYFGKVSRVFRLAQEVSDENAQAKYSDGVLELHLPKQAVTQAKRISVQ